MVIRVRAISLTGALIASALFISGCASYQDHVAGSRELLQQRKFDEAIASFQKKAEEASGDKLAYQLEFATALHQAGRYEESNKQFAIADKMCDVNDYTSVSREAGAMIMQEGVIQYKADTFEFLMITVYQALNYIMLGDYENAQVMARKLNEKINKIELDKESKKEQTAIASYLAGMMWDAQGDWDNAYVLYNKAHEAQPETDMIKRDLLISSKRSGREDTYESLKKKWPQLDKTVDWKSLKGQGEFVFIFQQGWMARKRQSNADRTLPMLVPQPAQVYSVDAKIDDKVLHSEKVYDLDQVAIQTLSEDMKRLVARAIARKASRVAVTEISRNNSDNAALGIASVAALAFEIMDVADLRQWSTLPSSIQLVKVYLPPGKHSVAVTPFNVKDSAPIWSGDIEIKKGKKVFSTSRAF